MNIIVAVSIVWGIGYKNDLLFRIKEDLQRFKQFTTNKVVVMGRKTFESLPKSRRPLPNRTNIVLTYNEKWRAEGVTVCNSIPALLNILEAYDPEDIFIIGGEEIYTKMFSHCKTAYVTKINHAPPADVFFPNMDKRLEWKLENESPVNVQDGLEYKFCTYVRSN